MVNTGKTSYGCHSCKETHQKCDQTLPAYARCIRRKSKMRISRLAFHHFRDETQAIPTKFDRGRRQAKDLTPQASTPETLARPQNPESILTSLGSPFTLVGTTQQHFALIVCFSRRAGMNIDGGNPHGFIEFLSQLVAVAKLNSPLERAISRFLYLLVSIF